MSFHKCICGISQMYGCLLKAFLAVLDVDENSHQMLLVMQVCKMCMCVYENVVKLIVFCPDIV